MLGTIRAKMHCYGVETSEGQWKGKPALARKVKLSMVYPSKDCPENQLFVEASPFGNFEITIQNPAAAKDIEVGKDYYVDIGPAN